MFSTLDQYFAKRAAHYLGGLSEEEEVLFAAVMAAAREGHLCLDKKGEVFDGDKSLKEMIERGFEKLKPNPFLHRHKDRVYLMKNWALEQSIRHHLERLACHEPAQILQFPLQEKLNVEQNEAVKTALHYKLSFITGGPGTGKTFTAAAIAEAFLAKTPSAKILLAAPTARAADHLQKRLLSASIQAQSGTLHKVIGIKNIKRPVSIPFLDADLIIIDECSMIDAELFAALLAALSETSTVVFMGDPDQLDPVGIGSLFSDLVQTDLSLPIGKVHLKRCLRVEDQPLLALASHVQSGAPCEWPLLDWPLDELLYEKLWSFTKEFWVEPFSRFRILSVLRQGPFGTETINRYIAQKVCKGRSFKAPIQITRNDPVTQLCNGEIGTLVQTPDGSYALFEGFKDPIPVSMLPSYEYAFCTSVHKSQGSEYEEVLLIAPPGSESFGKEMLYTAITRAKKRLHIVSTSEILAKMQARRSRKLSGFGDTT